MFAQVGQVFSMMCIVFPLDKHSDFANLQSNLHEIWVNEYSSSLKKDQRYTPSDCFETFGPVNFPVMAGVGSVRLGR